MIELTKEQEQHIERYLQQVAAALRGRLDEEQCNRALQRLRTRIERQGTILGTADSTELDIVNILRKMGTPENQAAILLRVWGDATVEPTGGASERDMPSRQRSVDTDSAAQNVPITQADTGQTNPKPMTPVLSKRIQPVWLGVCAYVAASADIPSWAVRILTVLLGCVTAPLLILVYVSGYFWLRVTARIDTSKPLHPWRIIFYPLFTALALGLIHGVGYAVIKGVYIAHDIWLERTVPDMGDWGWLESESRILVIGVFILLLPLALLSATPLENRWDHTLKRFTQACVAVYAIIISFGIASFVTGIILAFVGEFTL